MALMKTEKKKRKRKKKSMVSSSLFVKTGRKSDSRTKSGVVLLSDSAHPPFQIPLISF